CLLLWSSGRFSTVLGKPYSNLAHNLFASACDRRRPTTPFATRHLRSSSWPSVATQPAFIFTTCATATHSLACDSKRRSRACHAPNDSYDCNLSSQQKVLNRAR